MRSIVNEMHGLLQEEPDVLLAEVRGLFREAGVELPAEANLADANAIIEVVVQAEEFEQLDEVLKRLFKGAGKLLWKAAKISAKVKIALIAPMMLGPVLTYKLAKYVLRKKTPGSDGGSGELLRTAEPFTIGDAAFHPYGTDRWRARLVGGYQMNLRYRPKTQTFEAEVDGHPLGSWQEDDLGYAVHAALMVAQSAEVDEPEPEPED
jgi:hypothetical protein